MEVWKDIKGYNGKYQVSNEGNVRSFSKWANGRILKGGKTKGNPQPYKFVALVNGSRKNIKNHYIHRLVAEAFVPNPHNYPEVNHKDGDTFNNNSENLEWCTHAYNMIHASQSGVLARGQSVQSGSLHPNAKAVLQLTKGGELVKEWGSVNQVMRETGMMANEIFKCCNPQKYPHVKTAYGYRWRYRDGKTDNKEEQKKENGR